MSKGILDALLVAEEKHLIDWKVSFSYKSGSVCTRFKDVILLSLFHGDFNRELSRKQKNALKTVLGFINDKDSELRQRDIKSIKIYSALRRQ